MNGVVVRNAEDLRPLVHADSAAARAIEDSVQARGTADLVTGVGLGVGVAGAVTAGALLSTFIFATKPDREQSVSPFAIGGVVAGGVGLLGSGALIAWGMTIRDEEVDAQNVAFRTFDAGLWQKLALDGPVPDRGRMPSIRD